MSHTYEYPRPALTVDAVVFGYDGESLSVLLIERAGAPYAGHWALPGGFVDMDESLDDAARRELEEETGLSGLYLEQLYTFGRPDRDPRGRVVSVAYFALVDLVSHPPAAASDARAAKYFAIDDLPPLAFDHADVMRVAIERLRAKVRYRPVGFELLPPKFTLTELQRLYETVLETTFDKRNFRRRMLQSDLLVPLDDVQQGVAHRAARLYQFDEARYRELERQGFEWAF